MLNRRLVYFVDLFSLWPALPSFIYVILQGYVPLFVNATAGSTVYGAFDPINEIADICEKYNLWLHVDVSSWVSHCCVVGVVSSALCVFTALPCPLRVPGVVDCWCLESTAISSVELSGKRAQKHELLSSTGLHRLMNVWIKLCRANSVTWNPHKMMGVPLQCSAILVREKVKPNTLPKNILLLSNQYIWDLFGDPAYSDCINLKEAN